MKANMHGHVGHALSAVAGLLLLTLLLAGWGTSRPGPPAAAGSPVAAALSVPASSCTTPARLTAGMTVASWRLGAVHFVSPDTGVAITAPQIPCDVPAGSGATQAQPVLLAVSTDAGRRWVTQGSALPSSQSPAFEITWQVAALSARNVWVLTSSGKLFATGNGGLTWTPQPLPAPVVTLAQAGRELTALSCPLTQQDICHPQLHRMRLPAGRWQAEPLPRLATATFPQLSTASADAAVLLVDPDSGPATELVSTTDGGVRWTTRPVPAGPPRPVPFVPTPPGPGGICALPDVPLLATASASDWWLLCGAGVGMQKSAQAVLRTADGGRTWQVMAQTPSSFTAEPPNSLPYVTVLAFAASSPARLWITGINYAASSRNAGRSWTFAPDTVNPGGSTGLFDILSPADAWLLAPGTALWHTTDGIHWSQDGPAFYS